MFVGFRTIFTYWQRIQWTNFLMQICYYQTKFVHIWVYLKIRVVNYAVQWYLSASTHDFTKKNHRSLIRIFKTFFSLSDCFDRKQKRKNKVDLISKFGICENMCWPAHQKQSYGSYWLFLEVWKEKICKIFFLVNIKIYRWNQSKNPV